MYTKPHKTFDEQIDLLEKRGLIVNDKQVAKNVLASVNYYRFSGYAIQFMADSERKQFKAGVSVDDVLKVMTFDGKLRDLLAEALEHIEIDFRAKFAYEHSKKYGPMGYRDPGNFFSSQRHNDVMAKVKDIIDPPSGSPKEMSIAHLTQKYGEVPVWAMVEVVPFGSVVRMYQIMRMCDKPQIAMRYYAVDDHKVFDSYIKHLSVVRNMCAHHSRLWDRTFYGPRLSGIFHSVNWSSMDTRRLFCTLVLIHYMTRSIPKVCFDRDRWRSELISLLKDFQSLPNCNPFRIMGIPSNGFDPVWWEHQ